VRIPRLIPLAAVAILVAACSTGGASPTWSFGAPSAPAASAPAMSAAPASPAAPATRIEVTLSDMMRIEPAAMTVPAGVPVTFVVTNTGTVLHEFTLGDAADQEAHDKEMLEEGGMSMPRDEENAIGVEPGKTKELTYTFDAAGETLAGCHVIGHYAAGMKATITIQ